MVLGPIVLGLWKNSTSYWEWVAEAVCSLHGTWEANREMDKYRVFFMWPCCFGPVAAQCVMEGVCSRGLFTSLHLGSRERERNTQGSQYFLLGNTTVT
jgi:hypothetical protein